MAAAGTPRRATCSSCRASTTRAGCARTQSRRRTTTDAPRSTMRWLTACLIGLALLAGAGARAAPLDDARALDAQTDGFFQQGRYADAERAIRQALAIYER